MNILGIIPARGGSKGVPRKNIRLLCGRPLLAYTAEAALAAKRLTRVVLSTDDEEIAHIGSLLGLEVPFLRPKELGSDSTPTLPVVEYTLKKMSESGETFDAVCLLQPTNPLRRAEDIDNCIRDFVESDADSVVSVRRVPAEHDPEWVYRRNAEGMLELASGKTEPPPRRQDLPEAFHRDGSIYLTRSDVVLKDKSLYGTRIRAYEMPREFSLNIDTWEDWKRAEDLLSTRKTAASR